MDRERTLIQRFKDRPMVIINGPWCDIVVMCDVVINVVPNFIHLTNNAQQAVSFKVACARWAKLLTAHLGDISTIFFFFTTPPGKQ